MNYDLLIFDMDGTIIDNVALFERADAEFFRRRNLKINNQELVKILSGVHLRHGMQILQEKFNLNGNLDDLLEERRQLLAKQYQENLKYIAGFEDFFGNLYKTGLKSCIATSSDDFLLDIVIQKLQLNNKFGGRIFKASDVANASKPDPAVFLHAAKQMNVQPSRCIVIEDAPKGVEAANRAGMYSIGITTVLAREFLTHANMVIDSYDGFDISRLL